MLADFPPEVLGHIDDIVSLGPDREGDQQYQKLLHRDNTLDVMTGTPVLRRRQASWDTSQC